MPSIARKNLFEDIPRFLVAQAGIMFAVSLITIQTGILNGFVRSTGQLVEQSNADLWVSSKDILQLDFSLPIPLERLVEIRQVDGVAYAEPLIIQQTRWRSPDGQIAPVRIYGIDPNGQLFPTWPMRAGQVTDLETPYTIVADRASLNNLGLREVGQVGTLGSLPATLVGLATDTQSLVSGATVFTSLESANAYLTSSLDSSVKCTVKEGGELDCITSFDPKTTTAPSPAPPRRLSIGDPITYVLVKVEDGQNIERLQRALESKFPDIAVHTRDELATMTRDFWLNKTGVGFVLGLGAAVGFIVGVVVVSQILYASVSDHIREFGTLKAMGASDWVIYRVITEQALWMAVLGYLPSIALCYGLAFWTMSTKGILILITPWMAAGIFGITVVMCVGSALFAIQRVTSVDPAIVFKA